MGPAVSPWGNAGGELPFEMGMWNRLESLPTELLQDLNRERRRQEAIPHAAKQCRRHVSFQVAFPDGDGAREAMHGKPAGGRIMHRGWMAHKRMVARLKDHRGICV